MAEQKLGVFPLEASVERVAAAVRSMLRRAQMGARWEETVDTVAFDWSKLEQDNYVRSERAAGLLARMLTAGGPTPALIK